MFRIASRVAGIGTVFLLVAGTAQAQINGFNNGVGWTANGSTSFTTPDTAQLTDSNNFEANSVFFDTRQSISKFTATFTYQLASFPPGGLNPADGVVFAIQNQGLTAIGGSGSGLGFSSISPGAGVFLNVFAGHNPPSTGLVESDVNGGSPSSYTSTTPVDFTNEQDTNVLLTYNGTTLTEKLTQGSNSFTQDYTIDLAGLIGPKAFVGFTGGTGGGASTQDVSNFHFTSVPEPAPVAAFAVAGLGLMGLAWKRRRAAA